MGLDAMILGFWMLSFKLTFSLFSFIFIKRLFSSFLLSSCWRWNSNTSATYAKKGFIRKDPDARQDWRQYKMVGWHHQLDGHELEEALGVGDGQGSLACCSPWVAKTGTWLSDWTELGQNEVCSLQGRISDSSEGLLQSGSGRKSMYKVLVKVEFDAIKHSLYKRFFANHEDLMEPWKDLMLL